MATKEIIPRPLPAFDSRPDLPIALVVGAGGMSMAIAQRLGQCHRVVIASMCQTELALAQERLHELGVVSATVCCDITNGKSVAMLDQSTAQLGPLTTLVHVAAVSPATADWSTIMAVNLVGAARVEQCMRSRIRPGGVAVFISSSGGHIQRPNKEIIEILDDPLSANFLTNLGTAVADNLEPGRAYSLSKWALNRLVKRQAVTWGARHSRILSLSPGIIDTLMGAAADAHSSGNSKAIMREKIPLGRDGTMAEIADAVEFLISDRARYITGIDLLVDGGLVAAMAFAED